MQDATTVLRQIEQYEETLHVACLAPRTGRIVPLQCEAFTGLYGSLASKRTFEAVARRLVESHWAANALIDSLRGPGGGPRTLEDLARVRNDIHAQLRAIRRTLSGQPHPVRRPGKDWLRAIMFRPLR